MRVTIKEIAKELGISHSTVSRVLNDKQSVLVSEPTRQRILQTAKRMGYRPNRLAQALKGDNTHLIGVFLPDGQDYFFQDVLTHLRRLMGHSRYELMVFATSQANIVRDWHRLLQWDLDGAFVFDYMFYVEGLQNALLHHAGYIPPIVGLFSNEATQLQDYVAVDFSPALNELLERLYQQGCRRLGYVGPPDSLQPVEQRFGVCAGFARAHRMELCPVGLLPGNDLLAASRLTLRTYVEEGYPLPDAFFCQNDEIGLGAYRGLYECGLSVPEQVFLAGCDNIPYIAYLPTPLTSIALPVEEACKQGWRILQSRMAVPDGPPVQAIISATLQWRASTERGELR
jgi:LacI family transcriptional regulator